MWPCQCRSPVHSPECLTRLIYFHWLFRLCGSVRQRVSIRRSLAHSIPAALPAAFPANPEACGSKPLSAAVPGLPVVEASPEVLARVSTEPDRVVIRSEACTIAGSPLVDSLRLNERYDFFVETTFTWQPEDRTATGEEAIYSRTEIRVDVRPPGPFKVVPRWILEAVGNRVMSLALSGLQTTFVANLGDDYVRWATSEAYRSERARIASEA